MQVLSIYLVDNKGKRAHFGSTTSIQNTDWARINLETLKAKGWLHPKVKEIRIEIEDR